MRRLLIGFLAVAVLAAGGQFLLWQAATARLRGGFDAWRDACLASGWTVRSGEPTRGGWPLAARLTVPALRLEAGDAVVPGGVSWEAGDVALELALLQPGTLKLRPQGHQSLRLGSLPTLEYGFGRVAVTLPLRPGAAPDEAGILAKAAWMRSAGGPGLTVADLTGHLARHGSAGNPPIELGLRAEAIDLPGGPWPFGPRLSSVSLDATLRGSWPPGGGSLDVQRLSLGWGPLGLTGNGALSLDEAAQPAGTGTVRVLGYAESLDALVAAGTIAPRTAIAIKGVLSLLVRTPEGGLPQVELPLSLRDRTLSTGNIPLLQLPPVTWPVGR